MSLKDWDAELAAAKADIDRLYAEHARERKEKGLAPLIERQVRTVQATLDTERALERCRRLGEKDVLMLPREAALVHGARRYVEVARALLAARGKHLARAFWTRLVRVRLVGSDGELEADDLVALAVRHANLTKTERYLAGTLVRIRRQKAELTERYHEVEIALANKDSGGSFAAPLGATPEEALASRHGRALEAYLRAVGAQVAPAAAAALGGEDDDDDLGAILAAERLERRSAGLLGLCRSLVLSRLQSPAARPSPRALGRFSVALRQLDELESETQRAHAAKAARQPPPARPVITRGS